MIQERSPRSSRVPSPASPPDSCKPIEAKLESLKNISGAALRDVLQKNALIFGDPRFFPDIGLKAVQKRSARLL